jgi:hypothetical protein
MHSIVHLPRAGEFCFIEVMLVYVKGSMQAVRFWYVQRGSETRGYSHTQSVYTHVCSV